ncbi:PD-(D/E)XK nuclease family protein [Elusimicrobiota bacterium]
MAYQRTEYPQWSWSSSRKSTFTECHRKYYYNYYLSHNGWENDAPEEAKRVYKLKNLDGIHLLFGSAIHEVAEEICRAAVSSQEIPGIQTVKDKIRDILNKAWKESKEPHLWESNPKKYSMLFSFYYGSGLNENTIDKIKGKMDKAIPNLFSSDTVKEISSSDDYEIKIAESMDTFEMFDTAIYAIPDLVLKRPDGKWVVVDWKTGKEHDSHPNQINIYALYLKEKWGIKEKDLTGRVEYLVTGKSVDVPIDKKSISQTCKEIEKSINEMKGFLKDPDNNIPFEKEKYPLAKHRNFCKWCNFYELCEKELKAAR